MTLFPRPESRPIKLRQVGAQLEIESGEELQPRPWLQDHFLARFWINGQPYIPTPPDEWREERSGGGMEPPRRKQFRLQLELDRTRLGARPGDRIGVQLLYLDDGWQPIGDEARLEQLSHFDNLERVLWTNRIELIAP